MVAALEETPELVLWTGFPNKAQRVFVCELTLSSFVYPRRIQVGAWTARQLSWCLDQLSRSRSMGSFLRWFVKTFRGDATSDDVIDRAFQFLSGCEYLIPTSIGAIEGIAKHHLRDQKIDYGPYIVAVENLFRPPWMKGADEAGIPLPLAERLHWLIPGDSSVDAAMRLIRNAIESGRLEKLEEIDLLILHKALDMAPMVDRDGLLSLGFSNDE